MTNKTIGIIAPAAAIKEGEKESIEAGIEFLKSKGFNIKLAANVMDSWELFPEAESFLAGNHEKRLEDTLNIWLDDEVDFLWALRGGYGCSYLLEGLYNLSEKPLLGYSDLTAIFAFLQSTNYKAPLFHAPMISELSSLNIEEQGTLLYILNNLHDFSKEDYLKRFFPKLDFKDKIIGGNLSVLCSLLGTKFLPKTDDCIVFIEECNEPAYKIDRMFKQLMLSEYIENIKELWLGEGLNAQYNIKALEAYCDSNWIKLVKDLPFGHAKQMVLPLG